MLSGYWLLADLDGTLISTPHKAKGQYLPITSSPCYDPIRRWLLNGGSVCVVTTADRRVIDQVYIPLRRTLRESEGRCRTATLAAQNTVAVDLSRTEKAKDVGQRVISAAAADLPKCRGGRLLLSLYTGAVLYCCSADSVAMVPHYADSIHCATKESVELTLKFHTNLPKAMVMNASLFDSSGRSTAGPNISYNGSGGYSGGAEAVRERFCVRGTCIDRNTSQRLQFRLKKIYEAYMRDIISGEPNVVAVLSHMSQRYQRMWKTLLTYLEVMHAASQGQPGPHFSPSSASNDTDMSALYRGAAQDPKKVQWKLGYISSREDMLAALGILRVEYVEAHIDFEHEAHQTQQGSSGSSAEEAMVIQHAIDVLTRGVPEAARKLSDSTTQSFARFMTGLLGTDYKDMKKRLHSTSPAYPDVAQVILLGIPIALYSRYFKDAVGSFICGGVNAMPQPNSVVFSKIGVSKSTALRYLFGKDRVASSGEESSSPSSECAATEDVSSSSSVDTQMNYAGVVREGRAVALGDNPQSTDYELTVFNDIPFISIEKDSQRDERHRRIFRRLERAESLEMRGIEPRLPDGSPAPTYQDLVNSLQRSGPLMDDRLLRHLTHVGGEEGGTALFVKELMNLLHVPVVNALPPPSVAVATKPVTKEDFRVSMELAAVMARSKAQQRSLSKL